MAERMKPIVRVEDLEPKIRRLAEEMARSGEEAGEEGRRIAIERGQAFRTMPTNTDIEHLIQAAKEALESEILIAEETVAPIEAGEQFIRLIERDLEVAKRALAHLKLPQLRRLADDVGLDSKGNQEDIVARIAREYAGDPAEVARLVLKYEEATPDRGVIDRLYAVQQPMEDIDDAASGFADLAGRYIRVGIAKWFVFSRSRADENGFWLEGLYRFYSASAKREGEEFELVSVPSDAEVTARVREDQRFIEVRARGDAESRAILRAIEWGTKLRHADVFPLNVTVSEGRLMGWDHRSVFLLHFLDRVLPDRGVQIVNLTSGRFETAAAAQGFSRTPTVRSVALQGQHILDSKAACELLVQGRALVEVSLDVLFRPTPDHELLLPIRVSLAGDHVSALTGFGTYSPDTAHELHRELVKRLRSGLARGVEVDERLEGLAQRIAARARTEEPVRRADIFAPPEDWMRDTTGDGDDDDESEDEPSPGPNIFARPLDWMRDTTGDRDDDDDDESEDEPSPGPSVTA